MKDRLMENPASKGGMVSQYHVGQFVEYIHDSTSKAFVPGRIVKLHKSCSSGVAEIRPGDGSHKVSRRLIHVRKELVHAHV